VNQTTAVSPIELDAGRQWRLVRPPIRVRGAPIVGDFHVATALVALVAAHQSATLEAQVVHAHAGREWVGPDDPIEYGREPPDRLSGSPCARRIAHHVPAVSTELETRVRALVNAEPTEREPRGMRRAAIRFVQ
jgi:hypothetical protein